MPCKKLFCFPLSCFANPATYRFKSVGFGEHFSGQRGLAQFWLTRKYYFCVIQPLFIISPQSALSIRTVKPWGSNRFYDENNSGVQSSGCFSLSLVDRSLILTYHVVTLRDGFNRLYISHGQQVALLSGFLVS